MSSTTTDNRLGWVISRLKREGKWNKIKKQKQKNIYTTFQNNEKKKIIVEKPESSSIYENFMFILTSHILTKLIVFFLEKETIFYVTNKYIYIYDNSYLTWFNGTERYQHNKYY